MSIEFNSGIFGSDKDELLTAEAGGLNVRQLARTPAPAALGAPARRPLRRAAVGAQAIEGVPEAYCITSKGTVQDGWRHNDRDIRTWKSIIKGEIPPKGSPGDSHLCRALAAKIR